ncbi:MAG: 30S ribosomal protein S4 [Sorangiineae bacterium]|nr:30S ribosomal protein S4 [Polyangiaceae bacterium]MEB2322307.1 30S ribosomal protein S4 [Sorangiineae bacterium]
MSRYVGPRLKKMRALGVDLPGLSPKTIERRPYPPGQHGQGRRKISEYGLRLREKQKVRYGYGVTERQLRRLVKEAKVSKEATGDKLVELLERRLDNTVFRAGFARTIPGARQLINHGHVLVNGARVDIASYRVSVGEVIRVKRDASSGAPGASPAAARPETPWLAVEPESASATVAGLPERGAAPFQLQPQLVVEYYAQRL